MVWILRRATPRASRASAEHPEASSRLSAHMPAVVVLGDEFEIDRAHSAVTVLDL
jgi:hypothetical protein